MAMAPPEHPVFTPPDDPEARIWRYMDFTKYVAMLASGSLFFCRADKLGDSFEGTLTRGTVEAWRAEVAQHNLSSRTEHAFHELFRGYRRWTFVNCWHVGQHESAAMWKLYSKSEEAVAIQSTYSRLRKVLPDNVYIGIVRYLDYDCDQIPCDNTMWPIVFKRRSFEHERELRAVIQEGPPPPERSGQSGAGT